MMVLSKKGWVESIEKSLTHLTFATARWRRRSARAAKRKKTAAASSRSGRRRVAGPRPRPRDGTEPSSLFRSCRRMEPPCQMRLGVWIYIFIQSELERRAARWLTVRWTRYRKERGQVPLRAWLVVGAYKCPRVDGWRRHPTRRHARLPGRRPSGDGAWGVGGSFSFVSSDQDLEKK